MLLAALNVSPRSLCLYWLEASGYRPMSIVFEGVTEPHWPASVTDALFVPPKRFEARRTARKFLSWLGSVGVPVEPWVAALEGAPSVPPPGHGTGAVGRAYQLGDFIVKLTKDADEAAHAMALVGVNVPFLARIFDVRQVDAGVRLFAIVQERVNTGISKRYRGAGTAVYRYLDDYGVVKDVDTALETVSRLYLSPKQRGDRQFLVAVRAVLDAIYRMREDLGISYVDSHGGNLGFKGRNLAVFDMGRAKSTNKPAVAAL